MDCHFLLQGIFPTQESNPGLPHCRQTLYHLSHQGSPNLHVYYKLQVNQLGFKKYSSFCHFLPYHSHRSLSRVRLFATPRTIACQAPLSMGFSRQKCWSELLFPSPGDLPNPGIEPGSPALQADTLPSEPPGKPGLSEYC